MTHIYSVSRLRMRGIVSHSMCVYSVPSRHRNNYINIGIFKQHYKTLKTIGPIAVLRLSSSIQILQAVLQKSLTITKNV